VLVAGAAIVLLMMGRDSIVALVFGMVLLVVAVVLRPRTGRIPRGLSLLRSADAPRLFDLLDHIAREVGGKPPTLVVIDADLNASYGVYGFRRQRLLTIGAPLWCMLEPSARVALLSHEIGHGVNGDSRRGLLVGSALDSLALWHEMLRGERGSFVDGSPESSLTTAGSFVSRVALRPLAWMVSGLLHLELLLLLRSSQRGEYLADRIAARVGSSEGARSLLETLMLVEPCADRLRRAALRGESDLLAQARQYVTELPDSERERLRRIAERTHHRVDETHPPDHLRRELVRTQPAEPGRIVLSTQASADLDAELHPQLARAEKELRDALRRSLYY
jgi:Zn-dependent protease with chaperone function